MLPKNPQQWERVDRFLMSFSPKEKIALIYDSDPDGLCSAVIMNTLIKRLRGKPADLQLTQPKGTKNTIHPDIYRILKNKKVSKAIFLDLAAHEDAAAFKKLERQCETLVIDHHTFFQDITSDRTVLALPQLLADDIEPSRYATSKLSYDLANRHTNLEDKDWVSALGTISDMAASAWPEWMAKVFEKHKLKPKPNDWFHTDLGKISGMFFAAMTINEKNVKYCFERLMKAEKPQDVIKDKKLGALRRSFDREINIWVKQAPKLMEKDSKLKFIWYEVKPKYRINSPISTIFSLKPQYRDWVIVIVDEDKNVVRISGRCQSRRVKMNELFRNATKGLKNAAGGGHVPAAGGHCLPKDLDTFKKRILDSISKNLYTTKEKQSAKR